MVSSPDITERIRQCERHLATFRATLGRLDRERAQINDQKKLAKFDRQTASWRRSAEENIPLATARLEALRAEQRVAQAAAAAAPAESKGQRSQAAAVSVVTAHRNTAAGGSPSAAQAQGATAADMMAVVESRNAGQRFATGAPLSADWTDVIEKQNAKMSAGQNASADVVPVPEGRNAGQHSAASGSLSADWADVIEKQNARLASNGGGRPLRTIGRHPTPPGFD